MIQSHMLSFSARLGVLVFGVAVLLASPSARAVDGVIEISHAQALVGGVVGGAVDGPGYPVTLSVPGSYRLTSNLDVDTLNTTAIQVTTTTWRSI